MISGSMLCTVLRIAGAVQNTASFRPGSSVSRQCDRYASHTSVAPMIAPTNSPAKYLGTSLPLRVAVDREPERHRRVEMRAAELPDREDADHHAHRPAQGDHDPAAVLRLGLAQQHAATTPSPSRIRSAVPIASAPKMLKASPPPHYVESADRRRVGTLPVCADRGSGERLRLPCRAACAVDVAPGPGGRRCAGRGSSRGPCGPPSGSSRASPPRRRRPSGAARRRARSRPPGARSASSAGSSASTIVLSPGSALPRCLDAGRPGRVQRFRPARQVELRLAARLAVPSCRNSVPYSGPAAPPTVETSVIPTALSSAPMSSPSCASSFSTALRIPRSMLVPWSPSPIAVSSLVELGPVLGDRRPRSRAIQPRTVGGR